MMVMSNKDIEVSEFCDWHRFQGEWDFESGCGNYFETLENADLEEINFLFCPFCGKKIKETVLTNALDITR